MKKWKILREAVVYKNRLFKIRKETCVVPRTGKKYDYFYEDSADWVNVVAITDKGKILLIKQYRHAIRDFTLEIPGGVMDKTDKNPLETARRELLEETGYGGGRFRLIGKCRPNPAIINNTTYTFLAKGVKKIDEQSPDSTEEIEVMEVLPSKIEGLIRNGKIAHTLVITALHFFALSHRK